MLTAGAALSYSLLSPVLHLELSGEVRGGSGRAREHRGRRRRRHEAVQAITSTSAWNGAGAGRVLKAAKGSVAGLAAGDGIPMVSFTDPLGVCTGSCISASFYSYSLRAPGSGSYRLTDADIVFKSPSSLAWTSQGEDPGGAGDGRPHGGSARAMIPPCASSTRL